MQPSTILERLLQPAKIIRCLQFALVPALLVYATSVLVLSGLGFDTVQILRDPAQISGQNSFWGFVSSIGVWLWVAAVAICGFALSGQGQVKTPSQRELLWFIGVFSLMLAVDDYFLIHDRYVSQRICFLLYALCAGAMLLRHYRTILNIEPFGYLLACGLLACSIFADLTQKRWGISYEAVQVIEEGCKFLGGAVWLYFCSRVAGYRQS